MPTTSLVTYTSRDGVVTPNVTCVQAARLAQTDYPRSGILHRAVAAHAEGKQLNFRMVLVRAIVAAQIPVGAVTFP